MRERRAVRFICFRVEDLPDLAHYGLEFFVPRVKVRRYANARSRAKVHQKIAAQKLGCYLLAVRNIDHNRSAALDRLLGTIDLEARVFGDLDQTSCLPDRLLANLLDSDLVN